MSENGEIYTAGKKFTAAGNDGMDKFHLWIHIHNTSDTSLVYIWNVHCLLVELMNGW